MMIITTPCWKCDKIMKMALISDENTDYRGPETFSKEETQTAIKHEVILRKVHSRTAREEYLANICPHCDDFIGKHYFFTNYYIPAVTGELEFTEIAIEKE